MKQLQWVGNTVITPHVHESPNSCKYLKYVGMSERTFVNYYECTLCGVIVQFMRNTQDHTFTKIIPT